MQKHANRTEKNKNRNVDHHNSRYTYMQIHTYTRTSISIPYFTLTQHIRVWNERLTPQNIYGVINAGLECEHGGSSSLTKQAITLLGELLMLSLSL